MKSWRALSSFSFLRRQQTTYDTVFLSYTSIAPINFLSNFLLGRISRDIHLGLHIFRNKSIAHMLLHTLYRYISYSFDYIFFFYFNYFAWARLSYFHGFWLPSSTFINQNDLGSVRFRFLPSHRNIRIATAPLDSVWVGAVGGKGSLNWKSQRYFPETVRSFSPFQPFSNGQW